MPPANTRRLPGRLDQKQAHRALGEAMERALVQDGATPTAKQSFTTAGGVKVDCVGILPDGKPTSNRLCYAVFDHYYVQANLVWKREGKEEDAFSRSDEVVRAIMDRFHENPDL